MKIRELDIVVLRKDINKYGLAKGDVGTVVHVHGKGEAFMVEFIEASGYTIAVLTLKPKDIRPMKKREILHAREFAGV